MIKAIAFITQTKGTIENAIEAITIFSFYLPIVKLHYKVLLEIRGKKCMRIAHNNTFSTSSGARSFAESPSG